MIMDIKCPYCDTDDVTIRSSDYDWTSYDNAVVTWDGKCKRCHMRFVISETISVDSRLVARDSEHLNMLVEEEIKEERGE